MSAAAKKRTPKEFDHAKLVALTEPIMVYVSRITGGKQQPIDLPHKPGEDYPGKGWTQEDILQLPHFLSTQWSGGGLYNCRATGSNGETMEWDIYFPPNQIPEIQPPTMRPATAAGQTPIVPLPFGGVANAPPSWMAQVAQQYQQPQQQQVPMSYLGYNPYIPPAGYGPAPYGGLLQGQGFLGSRLGRSDEDKYQAEREARMALEAKIERERLQSEHQHQIANLTTEVRQTRELLGRRPDEDSPALRAALAQIEALQQQNQQNQLTQQMASMQQQTQQLFTEMRASTQQQLAALQSAITARPAGPDPTMLLMIESMKANAAAQSAVAQAQAQAQIEVARMQADSAREAARNGFGPQHMMDLISKVNMGTEHLGQAYRGAMDLMQQGVETMLNMQQPSMHPALEMVGQAAQGGLGILQQYVAGKQQTDVATVQAQAQSAQAQAMAQMQSGRMRGQQALAGAPPGTVAAVAAGQPSAVAAGRRDETVYFGPAWQAVQQFRGAVATGNVAPPQAAQGIVQAINHFATAGKAGGVPAFELWRQGSLAELVDALLPGAPTSYREQTTQSLYQLLQQLRAQQGGNSNKPTPVPN